MTKRDTASGRRIGIRFVAILLGVAVIAAAAGAAADAKPVRDRHRVDVTGATKTVGTTKDGFVDDRGTTTGKPFGNGKVRVLVDFQPNAVATGTFRIRDGRGTAFGTIDMTFAIDGFEITFNGTADFTGGKGLYKGIRGKDLKAYDHNTLDGQNGTIALKGFVTY